MNMADVAKAFEAGMKVVAANPEAEAAVEARIRARVQRRKAEAEAIADVKARGMLPPDVGPVPIAPARGVVEVVTMREIVGGSAYGSGYQALGELRPRRTVRIADIFDVMEEHARRRYEADPPSHETKHGEVIVHRFVPPFTSGQVAVARHYRALVERRSAAGMKCASVEAGRGSSAGGSFMETFLADGIALAAMQERIGDGFAMEVRRVRPSARGTKRTIRCRDLVDMVCLGDRNMSEVLRAHGWAEKQDHREALRRALGAILSRM